MFYSFFSSLARSKYLSIFSYFWCFFLLPAGMVKSTRRQVLLLIQGLVFWLGLGDPFVSQGTTEFYGFHFLGQIIITKMNRQCSQIRELIFYEFEQGHNAVEAAKIIWAKAEGAVDHRTVTRWSKKFHSGYKNFDNQARSVGLKPLTSKLCSKPERQIQWTWHLTVQSDLSHSKPMQKHLELLNCASCYQNIAKPLTHLSIIIINSWYFSI